ncbi:MAG: glycogen/starch/alpha-glucan phosphorylase [Clostridia bacterium]|nr:glycogen/starch/alpha-glucan phosphorylase [Clostridia bacterium]
MTKKQAKELIESKLSHFFGVSVENANFEHYYRAVSMIVRDMMAAGRRDFSAAADKAGAKRVYYLSMEFLMGRSLKNTLYNLNLTSTFASALKDYGISLERLYDCEPDAGLGNGGLGRLAACYLDAMATQGVHGRGYSILYEYGIFKQKIVDGWQTELPDNWLPGGDVWLVEKPESAVNVQLGGYVDESWDGDYHHVEVRGGNIIKAVPYDMFVAGKDGKGVSLLRLWSAKAPGLDMAKFNEGDYLRAVEENAMAEVISKILYPADNHPEGKSLRLKQQYFLVSASIQDIIRHHLHMFGTLENLPEKNAIHINDTHPTLCIPELMRIMLDECGYGWDEAWNLVTKTVAYTNHTVMKEALECWTEDLVQRLLPRIYQIIKEIDNRYRAYVWNCTGDADYVERTAIISHGIVKMANLCVAACHSVNGVSALHSDIIKDTIFNDYYRLTPDKFTNVTNGIAHRRWLCQSNPGLSKLITDSIGEGFVYNAAELKNLEGFAGDAAFLAELERVKLENKERTAKYIKRVSGVTLDPSSIFDIQVKRLHEYKRQQMNVLQILAKYLEIKNNPNGNYVPHTYIFGAKAASGYFMAKKIISLICAISDMINSDPVVSRYMKVYFFEDYCVTAAELLIPSAEISEQISLAGTEASGTSNMKFMMNGAVTLGTMDGANVEIFESVGADNIIIFGMNTEEVDALKHGGYYPRDYYVNNPELKAVIDFLERGVNGKKFPEITGSLINSDPYMALADFADYRAAQKKAETLYLDRDRWNRMSLMNIAGSGIFAADRSIRDYANNIWHTGVAKNNPKIKF